MGPEPLEWLHVSLINTATALDTVPLINIQDARERWSGENGENRLKRIAERRAKSSREREYWQERVAEELLVRARQEDKHKERLTERQGATA